MPTWNPAQCCCPCTKQADIGVLASGRAALSTSSFKMGHKALRRWQGYLERNEEDSEKLVEEDSKNQMELKNVVWEREQKDSGIAQV